MAGSPPRFSVNHWGTSDLTLPQARHADRCSEVPTSKPAETRKDHFRQRPVWNSDFRPVGDRAGPPLVGGACRNHAPFSTRIRRRQSPPSGSLRLQRRPRPTSDTPSSDVTSWGRGGAGPGGRPSALAPGGSALLPATSPRRTAGASRRPRAARPLQACRARVRVLRCHRDAVATAAGSGLGLREGGGGPENEWGTRGRVGGEEKT